MTLKLELVFPSLTFLFPWAPDGHCLGKIHTLTSLDYFPITVVEAKQHIIRSLLTEPRFKIKSLFISTISLLVRMEIDPKRLEECAK